MNDLLEKLDPGFFEPVRKIAHPKRPSRATGIMTSHAMLPITSMARGQS